MLDFKAKNKYLVGIDSDGCAFDTMELKHKECFIPNIINHYELQGISKYAREAAEFVNLYSKSRGINRFPALIEALEWLQKRPEVKARNYNIDIPKPLVDWIARETKLGNPALEVAVEETKDPVLEKALCWSKAVNEDIAGMVRGVPPFPFVRESIEKLDGHADILVVSATPQEALTREWEEHGLSKHIAAICGQEVGTKKQTLETAKQYEPNHALMIGDAPGDYKAAMANNVLFYPINPGAEEASWKRFFEEGIDRFLSDSFAGDYQDSLVEEFNGYLPENPPWPVEGNGCAGCCGCSK
jgi:phosphoglycolate phosphatase-like HAD superfamily hydrolase